MRRLLGVPEAQFKANDSLSECPQWPLKRIMGLTFERINAGLEEGFVSIITENQ